MVDRRWLAMSIDLPFVRRQSVHTAKCGRTETKKGFCNQLKRSFEVHFAVHLPGAEDRLYSQ